MKRRVAITIREVTDLAIREFSCENIPLTNDEGDFFTIPLDSETLKSKGYKNLTDAGRKILTGLNDITGIKRVFIGKNHLTVVIANGYSWGYIYPDIVHSFEHVFGRVKIYEEHQY